MTERPSVHRGVQGSVRPAPQLNSSVAGPKIHCERTVISDPLSLREFREAWEAVRSARNVIVGNLNAASMVGRGGSPEFRNLCFALILIAAFSVLEQVLLQLRDEGHYKSKDSRLKPLMKNSRGALPWQDFDLIDRAREDRNRSAHERVFLPHAVSRDYIAGIEQELVAWGVLPTATPQLWHW